MKLLEEDDLKGAAVIISKQRFHDEFDIESMLNKLIYNHNRVDIARILVSGRKDFERMLINIL